MTDPIKTLELLYNLIKLIELVKSNPEFFDIEYEDETNNNNNN